MTEYEQQLKTMREAPSKLRDLASTCEYHEVQLTALTTTQMREIGTAIEWSTGCIDNLQSQVNAQVAANQVLLSQNQSLRSQVVEWKPVSEVDQCVIGEQYALLTMYYDGSFRIDIGFAEQEDDAIVFEDDDGEEITEPSYWMLAKDFPLPQPPVTER